MARARRKNNTSANLGFEAQLWAAADALRNETERSQGADPEDPDEYRAANIFWVPKEARRSHLKGSAPDPKAGYFLAIPSHKMRD